MRRTLPLALAAAAMLLHAGLAVAQQAWPARPIHLIVPSAAGSGVDLAARRISELTGRLLGRPVVVENKPGAGGGIGAEYVARSAADGYTFMLATSAPLVLTPLMTRNLRYDAAHDFVGVGKLLASPYLVVAHRKAPFNTLAEMIAYDKANPGKLSFASDGAKNLAGLTGEMFNKMAGTCLLQVPYNSTARALTDTLSGQTQLTFMGPSLTADAIRSGDLKALGITTPRVPFFPDIPAIAEVVPGFEVTGWMVVVAPRRTPAPIIERMNAALTQAMQDPDWILEQQRINGHLVKVAGAPAEVDSFVAQEREKWGAVIKSLNIVSE